MKTTYVMKRFATVALCFVMTVGAVTMPVSTVSAASSSEINAEIKKLEQESKKKEAEIKQLNSQKASQQAVKSAIESQIANIQSQIALCNSIIRENNQKIAQNEDEIEKKNEETEAEIEAFKKRIRAIYMNGGTGSGIEVLLGAESFSDYIALSQLTLNVSKRDKKMVDDLAEEIKEIEAKSAENKKLIAEQNNIKQTLAAKQADLDAQVAAVNKVIGNLNSSTAQLDKENKNIESQIKNWQNELKRINTPSVSDTAVFVDGLFKWPVPSCTNVVSGFGSRWGSTHKGIDISGSGIYGKPIVAAADGTVTVSNNSCTHNYGKSGSCGCGGGYGNYVVISHGTYEGKTYRTVYGHMTSTAVSVGQQVKKGQVIGYVGSTGWSTGWHCHFEIVVNGTQVNPMNYFRTAK